MSSVGRLLAALRKAGDELAPAACVALFPSPWLRNMNHREGKGQSLMSPFLDLYMPQFVEFGDTTWRLR